jgi:hypothetical protein
MNTLLILFCVVGNGLSSFDCDCSGCTTGSSYFPSYPETQCDNVNGIWVDDGISSGTCADISCLYYDILSCATACAACSSGLESNSNCGDNGNHITTNDGDCSSKIFFNCVNNMAENDGDWSYCDMCMCDKYDSYTEGSGGNCMADDVLYSCYLSDNGCKTQLKQAWIIAFSCMALLAFCLAGACIVLLFRRKHARVDIV